MFTPGAKTQSTLLSIASLAIDTPSRYASFLFQVFDKTCVLGYKMVGLAWPILSFYMFLIPHGPSLNTIPSSLPGI